MDFAPTDAQQLIREAARDFTDTKIVPRGKANARNAHVDTGLGRALTGIDAFDAS